MLCKHFLNLFNAESGKNVVNIGPEALEILSAYSWPGNVRELRNAIEKMVVFSRGKTLTGKDVPEDIRNAAAESSGKGRWFGPAAGFAPTSMRDAERLMLQNALKATDGNRTKAAEQLGISRRTLHRKLKEFDLEDVGLHPQAD